MDQRTAGTPFFARFCFAPSLNGLERVVQPVQIGEEALLGQLRDIGVVPGVAARLAAHIHHALYCGLVASHTVSYHIEGGSGVVGLQAV